MKLYTSSAGIVRDTSTLTWTRTDAILRSDAADTVSTRHGEYPRSRLLCEIVHLSKLPRPCIHFIAHSSQLEAVCRGWRFALSHALDTRLTTHLTELDRLTMNQLDARI